MNRRRLVLAGGTVALTAIGVVRRNRRPSRVPQQLRPLPAAAAIPLYLIPIGADLFGFDIGGFIGGIFDTGFNIATDIKNFVFEVVENAINAVLNILDTVKTGLENAIHAVVATAEWLVQNATNAAAAVAHITTTTYNLLDQAFANFRDQAKAMLEGAWDGVKDWVLDEIPGWIKGVLGDAWDVLQALIGIGADGIGFLVNLIDDPIGFLWDLLGDVISDAIQAAIDAATLGWDAFTGLFWPFLAHEFGLPDDPYDMVRAGKLLWSVAIDIVNGRFEEAFRELLKGSEQYFEQEIPKQVHVHADTLVELLYSAMGIHPPDDLAESLRGV